MRHPSAPNNNGTSQRTRTRGAIRTHLGRKRTGPRRRNEPGGYAVHADPSDRRREEDLFDRLKGQFESLFAAASEKTASTFDAALDTACRTLEGAGEFTADGARRLREFLRRDVLHREHPELTFRSGDITSAGTLTCDNCGWTIVTQRSSMLPACPQCGDTHFRKTD